MKQICRNCQNAAETGEEKLDKNRLCNTFHSSLFFLSFNDNLQGQSKEGKLPFWKSNGSSIA
jgi:hypothetical protein